MIRDVMYKGISINAQVRNLWATSSFDTYGDIKATCTKYLPVFVIVTINICQISLSSLLSVVIIICCQYYLSLSLCVIIICHHRYLSSSLSVTIISCHHLYMLSLSVDIIICCHHYLSSSLSFIIICGHHYLWSSLSVIIIICGHHYLLPSLSVISSVVTIVCCYYLPLSLFVTFIAHNLISSLMHHSSFLILITQKKMYIYYLFQIWHGVVQLKVCQIMLSDSKSVIFLILKTHPCVSNICPFFCHSWTDSFLKWIFKMCINLCRAANGKEGTWTNLIDKLATALDIRLDT